MTSRSNYLLSDNLKLGEFQQQLLGTRVTKLNSGLGVLTRTLNPDHRANTKALMLDSGTLTEF